MSFVSSAYWTFLALWSARVCGVVITAPPTEHGANTDPALTCAGRAGRKKRMPLSCPGDIKPPGISQTVQDMCPKQYERKSTQEAPLARCPASSYEEATRSQREDWTSAHKDIGATQTQASESSPSDEDTEREGYRVVDVEDEGHPETPNYVQVVPGPDWSKVDFNSCPVFFLTAGLGQLSSERTENVNNMTKLDPFVHAMGVTFYSRDWAGVTERLFAKLGLPVCDFDDNVCSSQNTQGQLSRWSTFILATAYQRRFKLPCMIMMEDDISLPANFRKRLNKAPPMYADVPQIYRMAKWGEGYVFNLRAAELYHRLLYEKGIVGPTDQWLNHHMEEVVLRIEAMGLKALIRGGRGDIMRSQCPSDETFQYVSSRDETSFLPLLDAFTSEEEYDLAAVAWRFAGCTGANGQDR